MSYFAEIRGKLQSAVGILEQVKTNPANTAKAIGSLQQFLDQIETIETSKSPDKRAEIARMRAGLYKSLNLLDELQGNMADLYRQSIGDKKEWFESLSSKDQQSQQPLTYQCKQHYEWVTTVQELTSQINMLLLDESGDMEHQKLNQMKTAPLDDTIPPYHFGSDDTPAPPASSLSP